jgi:hypothetical protein
MVLTTLAVATLAATLTATASPSTAFRSSAHAFSGKVCGLIPASILVGTHVSAPCVQLKTRTSTLGTAYTANYGKQTPQSPDGINHFLGVSLTKLSPRGLAIWRLQRNRVLKSGDVLWHNAGSWAVLHTQVDDTQTTKGVEVKGANGTVVEVIGSYYVQVNLFDRPSTEPHVGSVLTLIAIHLSKLLK